MSQSVAFNTFRSLALGATALMLATAAASVLAAPLKTDADKSTVTIVFKQLNVPVEAKFKKFDAKIDFDPAKAEQTQATVDITMASFDLGDPEYNKEVLKKEWFNAAQFPQAKFVASSIKASGTGKYDVAGKLTIKGQTGDVRFPLTVSKAGAAQVFDGALPIKRTAYHIGEGEWADTGTVADEVVIKFHIVAQ